MKKIITVTILSLSIALTTHAQSDRVKQNKDEVIKTIKKILTSENLSNCKMKSLSKRIFTNDCSLFLEEETEYTRILHAKAAQGYKDMSLDEAFETHLLEEKLDSTSDKILDILTDHYHLDSYDNQPAVIEIEVQYKELLTEIKNIHYNITID